MNERGEVVPEAGDPSLSDDDVRLYWEIRRGDDDLSADDPRLENLRSLGVVFTEPLTGKPGARPPHRVERELIRRELDEVERRLRRIRRIPSVLGALDQVASGGRCDTDAVEIVKAPAVVDHLLHNAIEASSVIWSSQTRPRHAERLAVSAVRDVAILKAGGVRYRSLYPASARSRAPEADYARMTAETGAAESRTSSRRFPRMIITDTLGMISDRRRGEGGSEPAIVVRDPALLAWLREEYELHWEASDPWFPAPEDSPSNRELVERDILRMLSGGSTREAITRTLDISPRTYTTYMAALRERFRVRTNEQLMYELGRRRDTAADG
ncbi:MULTISPECIES: helix-turn-helix transcriptional regulator [unclassified Streptomyces]|uniref:helix-turn-helix transcriptional regulator n=1 Tax=unclassified Streptomyces TaxID=2593676 RepID=UPI000AD5719E|nr:MULTISPECIES: LuxR C-terminal-related transcriptional regulator [unclassified Streptomyces]